MPEGGSVRISGANILHSNGLTSLGLMNPGPSVRISVHDDGVGIPIEQQSRLFEPYFTTKRQGHGLGLYTAYSIIKRHEGAITFDTELGKGTTFNVFLPAAPGSAVTSSIDREGFEQGTGRVLVMDDEPVIRETLKELLDSLGYDAVAAADGEAAVRTFADEKRIGRPFDLVILDLVVPGGRGGLWAISRIAAEDPQVKAIVSSGYFDDPVLENPREYGFLATLRKPYSAQEITDVLRSIVRPGTG
jgi:CheY-like chemotaxis protein